MNTPTPPTIPHMADDKEPRSPMEMVALVLAGSVGLALNVLTFAALWAAFVRLDGGHSLVEDTAVCQILLAWGGAIITVLAAFLGYSFGRRDRP